MPGSGPVFEFFGFRLDFGRFELLRNGQPLRVDSRSPPIFNRDATALYYLLRRGEGSHAELWRTVVNSDLSEAVFPAIAVTAFDLSSDGKQVVYTTGADGSTRQLWLATVDRSSPAKRLATFDALSPHFGLSGQILFLHAEGDVNYLEQVEQDGSHRSRVVPYPVLDFQGVSPNRRWIIAAISRNSEANVPAVLAISSDGGKTVRICAGYCVPKWSSDGRFLFVPVEAASRNGPGRSLAIPLGPGETFPELPERGIAPLAEATVVPGAENVGRADLIPGKDLAHYAWVNTTVHRNLYQISLP
jgi:hypothetical protein